MSFGEPIALRGQAEVEGVAERRGDRRPAVDTRFLERLRAREPAAFDRLVMERTNDVYALLCRLTGDCEEARDLTQETFLRAFQSIAGFRGDSDLKTWLYRIAVNQARNRLRWWRRRRRGATISLDLPVEPDREGQSAGALPDETSADPERETLRRERETIVLGALSTLKRSFREAVVLRDIEGLTYEEIATALDIGVGTVKSRIARGRLELRAKLQGLV